MNVTKYFSTIALVMHYTLIEIISRNNNSSTQCLKKRTHTIDMT